MIDSKTTEIAPWKRTGFYNDRDVSSDESSTIPGFCRAEKISIGFYYKLKNQGLGPDEMELGRSKRITAAARRRWQQQREKASAA